MEPPASLKARALQWLAQREHSRLELRRKLLHAARRSSDDEVAATDATDATDPQAEVDALLDWLVAHRHLSETRFVETRVHAREARFGQRRIAQELKQHGTSLDADTAERLRESEFDRACAVWLRKFGTTPPADAASRARQMRFLAARGFAGDVIRRVVKDRDVD